ncbi:pre-rRNA 2'-O-ribose RNA methyltransferase FTSJ3 [Xyrauchen texanus]|uniref:pre-rRNA 2'-O-ribose RNA methyltransferase FTSJ3 n=1 Tax=Xyrauchen texanus TaxID=154827 RepID=UPI0022423F19|nr:pre-rRNA 2'-O-ribose RNA methyltransferase FTSJ3 [Xyrauchen texanus]XP_051977944.1 pre-rRNA 2'-O-ribose RNA methyltransferase FTSJ3 [Xyrauchen texanus]
MVEEYKQKWQEINAHPIRRVADAKACKKRRMLKKMEQAKKRHSSKASTKRLVLVKRRERSHTWWPKRVPDAKFPRPAGVKSTYCVVDGQLKKVIRGMKIKEQRKQGKGGQLRKAGMKTGKGHPNKMSFTISCPVLIF